MSLLFPLLLLKLVTSEFTEMPLWKGIKFNYFFSLWQWIRNRHSGDKHWIISSQHVLKSNINIYWSLVCFGYNLKTVYIMSSKAGKNCELLLFLKEKKLYLRQDWTPHYWQHISVKTGYFSFMKQIKVIRVCDCHICLLAIFQSGYETKRPFNIF